MNLLRTSICSLFIAFIFAACSSGSSKEPIVEIKDATISGHINISNVESWDSSTHKMIFRSFTKADRKTIAFEKELVKNESGSIRFKLDKVEIGYIKKTEIALVEINNPSNFVTWVYYGNFRVKAGSELDLPVMNIDLAKEAPKYLLTKIEESVFLRKCIGCHNSQALAADLDLTKMKTYANVEAKKSKIQKDKLLITPGDAESSFFYQVLVNHELAPGMGLILMNDEEMALIKQWIDEGAKQY